MTEGSLEITKLTFYGIRYHSNISQINESNHYRQNRYLELLQVDSLTESDCCSLLLFPPSEIRKRGEREKLTVMTCTARCTCKAGNLPAAARPATAAAATESMHRGTVNI